MHCYYYYHSPPPPDYQNIVSIYHMMIRINYHTWNADDILVYHSIYIHIRYVPHYLHTQSTSVTNAEVMGFVIFFDIPWVLILLE